MAQATTAKKPTTPAPAVKPVPPKAPAEHSASTLPTNDKGKPKILTERTYLDPHGKETTESHGTSLRVEWLGKSWTYTFKADDVGRMLAMRSAYTFAHNCLNSAINNEKNPKTPAEAMDAHTELMAEWASGRWESRRDIGAGGAKEPTINPEIMAEVVAEYARKNGKPQAVAADYLAKLRTDKSYAAKVRSNTDFRKAYDAKVGRTAKTADLI